MLVDIFALRFISYIFFGQRHHKQLASACMWRLHSPTLQHTQYLYTFHCLTTQATECIMSGKKYFECNLHNFELDDYKR